MGGGGRRRLFGRQLIGSRFYAFSAGGARASDRKAKARFAHSGFHGPADGRLVRPPRSDGNCAQNVAAPLETSAVKYAISSDRSNKTDIRCHGYIDAIDLRD